MNLVKPVPWIQYLFLAVFMMIFFPPAFYHVPSEGLDASWNVALHLAHKYNLTFGKDFVFTYGPLGILVTRMPIAISKFVYLLFDLYFYGSIFFLLKDIFKKQFGYGLAAFAFLSILLAIYEACDIMVFVLFLFNLFAWVKEPGKIPRLIQTMVLSLLGFYIKVNLGTVEITFLIMALIHTLYLQKLNLKIYAIIAVSYIATILLTSVILNVSLVGYVVGSLKLIDHYNDAMYARILEEQKVYRQSALFIILIGLLWIGYVLALSIRKKYVKKNLDELFIYTVTGLSIYVLFKGAFVRADGHMALFFHNITLLAVPLYLYCPPNIPKKLITIGSWVILIVAWSAMSDFSGNYPEKGLIRLSLVHDRIDAWKNYFHEIGDYDEQAANLMKPDTSNNEYRQIIGNHSADVVPTEVSMIYFNGLHYNPRPVIQSYSAYDEYLDNLNYQKYISPSAPDYILYAVGSLDNRYPFFDESKTKQAIFSHYTVVGRTKGHLILKKKETLTNLIKLEKTETIHAKLNEDILIPKFDGVVYSRINVKYTLKGKIRRFLYQPPPLSISVTPDGGEPQSYRAVVPILAGGVIINKFVYNNDDLQLMMQSDGRYASDIQKIRFEPDSLVNGFIDDITITNEYYRFGNKPEAEHAADSLQLAAYLNDFTPKTGDSTLYAKDSITYAIDNYRQTSHFVSLDGWAYRQMTDNDKIVINVVVQAKDKFYEIPTKMRSRDDIATFFKRQDIDSTGYSAIINKSQLPKGDYRIGLAIFDPKTQKRWLWYLYHQVQGEKP